MAVSEVMTVIIMFFSEIMNRVIVCLFSADLPMAITSVYCSSASVVSFDVKC